ncbi:MAG: hypothetical protein IAE67_00005 [Candidatus Competibacteraceae bacterium]|jgi:hypothetical protein|nr:hypothetical protein [Candidatus Competibacteraceae bacterium]
MQSPQYLSNLPAGVRAKLIELKCLIPKSLNGSTNVISGRFVNSSEISWAVVCSREAQSSILVFKENTGNKYDELGRWNEDHWLVTDRNKSFYRREISSVDKSYIMEHYQSYGGQSPPKIKYEAINDGYLEMSSTVYYFNENQWLKLTGAD